MLKVGLTGGIGSGKSTVAKVFKSLGISVYLSDSEAKKFLFSDFVIDQIKDRFGLSVFEDGNLSTAKIAAIVFNDDEQLSWLNQQIHPLVRNDFEEWTKKQTGSLYVIQEAAILFESVFYEHFDKIITVSADINQRISRVMSRDNVDEKEVMKRMKKQLSDVEKEKMSDYIIRNNDRDMILEQIIEIHNDLSILSKKK